MKLSSDGKEAFAMAEVTHYHRISTESDEESDSPEKYAVHLNYKDEKNQKAITWNCECVSRLLVLYILLMVALGFGISRMAPINHPSSNMHDDEHHSVFTKAAVAAGQQECSDVGVSILKEGGNAVDAAIATMLCQGVVEPEYCGIGGGFFMVFYNKTSNSSTVIDARTKAPLQSTKEMLNNITTGNDSPLSISVPGELKGFSHAYRNYGGGVSWKKLFTAAIEKAENGYAIGQQLASNLQKLKERILKTKTLCEMFCDSGKTDVKKAGVIVKNPLLAKTLKLISEKDVDSFYHGEMAAAMAEDIKNAGGILSKEDFGSYEIIERDTMKFNLSSDMILHVPPLPSGGPVLGLIMMILDSYHINSSIFEKDEVLYWHRTVESFKHAFGQRSYLGDPLFADGVDNFVQKFDSPKYIEKLREKIMDSKTFNDPKYYGSLSHFDTNYLSSTSHASVLAPNGDAVSITSSVNSHFGSLFMSPNTGVIFNNEMFDFATQVGVNDTSPNMIEPGKRPLSSMAPSITVDAESNDAVFIIGAAGGKQISTSLAISLARLLYFGTDDFDDAIKKPRLHHQLWPNTLYYEKAFNSSIIKSLEKIGHKVQAQSPRSHVNGIKNHVSHIHAYSDLREPGAGADGW